MNSNKEALIQDLANNTKGDRSWEDLARQYQLKNGEIARATWKEYRKVTKIAEKQEVNNYIGTLEDRVISLEEDLKTSQAQLLLRTREEIHNLEELIEKCNVDLTRYKIVRYRQNYWGNGNDPHWQVRVDLEIRKLDTDLNLQKDYLLKQIKEAQEDRRHCPHGMVWVDLGDEKKEYLYELDLPDAHLGKLAWGEETGEDYDLKIAVDRYRQAVSTLLTRAPLQKVEKIVIPIGNDFIHIDNAENQTTAGTTVDADSRFAKIVKVAKALLIETIDKLKAIAPVDVIIVRGNHDSTVTFMLGEVLEAWYHADPQVNVENSPKWRKYYQYGEVGVMFTHGEKEKHDELGLIFAQEQPLLWATSKYRFCKIGHFHKTKKLNYVGVDTHPGFQIQVIPSLSGTDEWHSGKGYLSNKQAKAFLYHKEEGEIAEYTYSV